jgi:hypothetical protein
MDGWWELKTEGEELNDIDREHIAKMIIQGYTGGEIVHEEEDELEGSENAVRRRQKDYILDRDNKTYSEA